MGHSLIYGEGLLEPELGRGGDAFKKCKGLYAVPILDLVMFINPEWKNHSVSNSFAILLIICFTLQSVLQLLYTFYECRTHIKILVREMLYEETSLYVE